LKKEYDSWQTEMMSLIQDSLAKKEEAKIHKREQKQKRNLQNRVAETNNVVEITA
jgi:hypothetical protein